MCDTVPEVNIEMLTRLSVKLTQHEGHRDETGIMVAINSQLLEVPLLVIIKEKSMKV